jgi:hypothetical protein
MALNAQLPKPSLRLTAGEPVAKPTDTQGVPLGRGSVSRTETHMILVSEDGSARLSVPRGDLAIPLVQFSWRKEGAEYLYTYRISNAKEAKVPIYSAWLRRVSWVGKPNYSQTEGIKPGESTALIARSPNPPVRQRLFLRSLGPKDFVEMLKMEWPISPGLEWDQFTTRHLHNNATTVWVIGPAERLEDTAQGGDEGEGVAELDGVH